MGIPSRNDNDRFVPPIEAFFYSELSKLGTVSQVDIEGYGFFCFKLQSFVVFSETRNDVGSTWINYHTSCFDQFVEFDFHLGRNRGDNDMLYQYHSTGFLCFWNGGRKNACFVSCCQVSIVFEVYTVHLLLISLISAQAIYYIYIYIIVYLYYILLYIHDMTTWGVIFVLYHESWRHVHPLHPHLSLGTLQHARQSENPEGGSRKIKGDGWGLDFTNWEVGKINQNQLPCLKALRKWSFINSLLVSKDPKVAFAKLVPWEAKVYGSLCWQVGGVSGTGRASRMVEAQLKLSMLMDAKNESCFLR